jgi:hypothetical protein
MNAFTLERKSHMIQEGIFRLEGWRIEFMNKPIDSLG